MSHINYCLRTLTCTDHATQELAALSLQNKQLHKELGRLQAENRRLKEEAQQRLFGVASLREGQHDKKTSFFTGLPNIATLMWLISFVENDLPRFSSIAHDNSVLLVLMKLRLNLQNYDLAQRFNISPSTVSEVLNQIIPKMAEKLKFLVHWPDKAEVIKSFPGVFKPKYRNARAIIDCTEIFIERPGNLTARASTWSNYKHNNTLKYLVAISPTGSISFISRAFGGRTSDKVVTQVWLPRST